nr:hypothetical protein [Tanacetum cinerariifolium]
MAAEGNGDPPVPDLRTMEELCQLSLNGRGGPIAPISIQATNFGLKNDMIQQVQNSCQFHGLPGDDANKHLDKFLHVTQSIKVNGVTDDALCLLTLRHRDTINAAAGGTFMKRTRVDPNLLNDFNMATNGNDDDGPPPNGGGDLPVPDLRMMEELCQATLNGRGGPIAPNAIQATNFGSNNIKVNGVSDDALRLYLFPHSLTHHTTTWFDRLPRNSINTFEQMAKMFLGKYFPPSMVTKLRNEITNFCQRPDESLFEAWERYKHSIDRCPNHNMVPVTQRDTFYNGLTLRHHDTINVVVGGTFMKRRPEECYDLIENMTAHHNDWDTYVQKTTVGHTQNVYAAGAYNQGGNSYQPQENRNLLSYRSDNYLGPPRNLFPPLDNPELTIRRRSRANPNILNDFEMVAEENGDLPVPDLQTIEELCQPSLNGRGGPIAPIAIQAMNFGLKNDMTQQSIKVNGVTDDALRLYLFPHFLTHHATAWFDRWSRNSINTFEQMAKIFIGKYFPPSMVTKLKNEITNFRQRPDESLFEAWERYKLSIDRCPNHNMLLVTQIDTFYNRLTLRHRDTINAVAGGTFMKRRPKECYDLIENMTAHHNDWDTSAQRITPNCETCGGPHSFTDCLATVGQTQNVYAVGAYQGGKRCHYQEYANQHDFFDKLNLELKNLYGQFMKMNTISSSGLGTLPGNTVTNPKEELKGITTRSGTAYQGPTIPTTSSALPPKKFLLPVKKVPTAEEKQCHCCED